MKIKRHLAPVAGALLLVTGAASVALLAGGGTASAAGEPSSAFGLELTIGGNEVIEPTPFVESTDGAPVSDSLIALPDNPLVSGGVVNASAQNGAAEASVTDLGVGDGLLAQLPPEVTGPLGDACTQLTDALSQVTGPLDEQVLNPILTQIGGVLDQISDATDGSPLDLSLLGALDLSRLTSLQLAGLCDVLAGDDQLIGADAVIAECTGDAGTTVITDLSALGLPVDIDVDEPNASVVIPGLLTITANRQTPNANGTFTVDALYVNLLDQVELTVASATCGEVTNDPGDPGDPVDEAPSPVPVESHVPVTG
ncbi:choice-of-anchor P family protein [Nocardioides sp. SYSU DS0651]|uniref:choice-of-anchor P family protein n=1 Tax=Nocardioides sp. SYSU DS0651 TaxID=3415955 RepID=UPI003F4C3052